MNFDYFNYVAEVGFAGICLVMQSITLPAALNFLKMKDKES